MTPFHSSDVETVFSSYPMDVRTQMLSLRELVFATASETEGVGAIEETLKWGEPSYLTVKPKSGTTVRMHWRPERPENCSIYFHCQTNMVATCRDLYADHFEFEGNRCMSFKTQEPPPEDVLRHCMALALTYHRRKKG
ncbi:MAG: DUF1801 domain-containing protein [Pseudomonadota bacterium]